jgi:hypothetical protein
MTDKEVRKPIHQKLIRKRPVIEAERVSSGKAYTETPSVYLVCSVTD